MKFMHTQISPNFDFNFVCFLTIFLMNLNFSMGLLPIFDLHPNPFICSLFSLRLTLLKAQYFAHSWPNCFNYFYFFPFIQS
jgi:hypothetical protein